MAKTESVSTEELPDYERMGVFYLGRVHDWERGEPTAEPLLYDAKDLTTHAVVVGMTGSGKTGLCLDLLEEAAIDGIPAIAIDPKGDIGNLLLTFPELRPADFRPWIDEGQALREGMTPDAFAARTAQRWREGLAAWGQDARRIQRLRDQVDLAIYTPGSQAGRPLTVLRSFAAPPAELLQDADALRDRISTAASGLLALINVSADPVTSREHILIANLLQHAWMQGRDLTLADLFRQIQQPPFQRLGILDLETFFPERERQALALRLNALLASPAFAGWLEGEPLDIHRLLAGPQGKPRISILSIAHLSETERMFFVSILLNEIVAWMRSQPGTSSLRALLYMDEVFGFFPPVANPPSKLPMLTLLKQARAYGLGCILATQNPVDLDYKGLSNAGTWFLGRLQTDRDKQRVIEGLQGASSQAGLPWDRAQLDAMLSRLDSRVFLMNNVHESRPVVFQTRWALSYLRGPLTREQIKGLSRDLSSAEKQLPDATTDSPTQDKDKTTGSQLDWSMLQPVTEAVGRATPASSAAAQETPQNAMPTDAPAIAPELKQTFIRPLLPQQPGERTLAIPMLLARCHAHYARASYDVDDWREWTFLIDPASYRPGEPWPEAGAWRVDPTGWTCEPGPIPEVPRSEIPELLATTRFIKSLTKELKSRVYRICPLVMYRFDELKLLSRPDETEAAFRARVALALQEQRELQREKLKSSYAKKFAAIESKLQRARLKLSREQEQYQGKAWDSAINLGGSLLGALFGRKVASVTNVNRASSTMKSLGRASRERNDVQQAEEQIETLTQELESLEAAFKKEIAGLKDRVDPTKLSLSSVELSPRKTDLAVEPPEVAWMPLGIAADGSRRALFETFES